MSPEAWRDHARFSCVVAAEVCYQKCAGFGELRSSDCAGLRGSGRQCGCQRQILYVSRDDDDDDDGDGDDEDNLPWNACYLERLSCSARVAIPEFDPSERDRHVFMISSCKSLWAHFVGASLQAKNAATLLTGATNHLGGLVAELYATMPSLASCGFVASMVAKQSNHHSSSLSEKHATRLSLTAKAKDDASTAVAAIARKLNVDTGGVAALVSDARHVLDEIAR